MPLPRRQNASEYCSPHCWGSSDTVSGYLEAAAVTKSVTAHDHGSLLERRQIRLVQEVSVRHHCAICIVCSRPGARLIQVHFPHLVIRFERAQCEMDVLHYRSWSVQRRGREQWFQHSIREEEEKGKGKRRNKSGSLRCSDASGTRVFRVGSPLANGAKLSFDDDGGARTTGHAEGMARGRSPCRSSRTLIASSEIF